VTCVAVSGHRGLPEHTVRLVDEAIRAELTKMVPDLVGLSCLADGADQIFARAVLDLGGQLEAVIPAEKYREGLPDQFKDEHDDLFEHASEVHKLAFVESTSEAHQAASERMVDLSDLLIAVWDGLPARSFGGTADVVNYARAHGVPVTVIWPEGSTRG
jgi:hypothetical protein